MKIKHHNHAILKALYPNNMQPSEFLYVVNGWERNWGGLWKCDLAFYCINEGFIYVNEQFEVYAETTAPAGLIYILPKFSPLPHRGNPKTALDTAKANESVRRLALRANIIMLAALDEYGKIATYIEKHPSSVSSCPAVKWAEGAMVMVRVRYGMAFYDLSLSLPEEARWHINKVASPLRTLVATRRFLHGANLSSAMMAESLGKWLLE